MTSLSGALLTLVPSRNRIIQHRLQYKVHSGPTTFAVRQHDSHHHSLFRVDLAASSVSLIQNHLTSAVGEVRNVLSVDAIGLLESIIREWTSAVQSLAEQLEAQLHLRQYRPQYLIYATLEFADAHRIQTDPTFLNRASFLVQNSSGSIRSDSAWKVCAQVLPKSEIHPI